MRSSRRSDEASAGQGSAFGQGSSWGTPSNSEAWSFSSPPIATSGPPASRVIRRQRVARFATPVLLGLAFAADGFRLGLASSGHSVVSAVLIGAGLIAVTLGLVAWAVHRARLRTGAPPARNLVWAMHSGAVSASIVVAVMFAVFGYGVGNALGNRHLGIPGAPGYSTFPGPAGKPMAVGSPWGAACEPIVFSVATGIPASVHVEIQRVVTEARDLGVDMTVENRQFVWFPPELYPQGLTNSDVQFVSIFANNDSTPTVSGGHPEHIGFEWNARVASNGTNEVITYLQGTLYLKNIAGSAAVERLATRQLIAFTQGIGASTAPGSGIADGSTVDRFSPGDVAAMQRMSGCRFQPQS
jgi:hypothetical protein